MSERCIYQYVDFWHGMISMISATRGILLVYGTIRLRNSHDILFQDFYSHTYFL